MKFPDFEKSADTLTEQFPEDAIKMAARTWHSLLQEKNIDRTVKAIAFQQLH